MLSSKSALMNSGAFSEITGSSFGSVFVVISLLSVSINPIWFLWVSVNQTLPLLSCVRNIVDRPSNEYEVNSFVWSENCHSLGADASLIHR